MSAAQLDLFADHDAAEGREARRAEKAAADAEWRGHRSIDCCSGEPIPPRVVDVAILGRREVPQARCGRCGAVVDIAALRTSHDLGWIECYPAAGGVVLHIEPWLGRHDEQHSPACRCGHPRGIHGRWDEAPTHARCLSHCGCTGYEVAA